MEPTNTADPEAEAEAALALIRTLGDSHAAPFLAAADADPAVLGMALGVLAARKLITVTCSGCGQQSEVEHNPLALVYPLPRLVTPPDAAR